MPPHLSVAPKWHACWPGRHGVLTRQPPEPHSREPTLPPKEANNVKQPLKERLCKLSIMGIQRYGGLGDGASFNAILEQTHVGWHLCLRNIILHSMSLRGDKSRDIDRPF